MKFNFPRLLLLTITVFCLAAVLAQAGETPTSSTPSDSVGAAGAAEADGKGLEARVKIGPGDLLEVHVYDEPDLLQTVRLDDVGEGKLSLIGTLHLAGLTTAQAGDLIAARLKQGRFLLAPQVSVLIREYSTQGVSVVGEVKTPGVYPVIGGQSLLDVLAAAGGATPLAGPELTIQRASDGSTLTVSLSKDAHQSLSSNVRLYPGDKVVVPRAGLVYVLGDVGRPGGFVMANNGRITLLQALAMAGGTTRTSSMNGARLLRRGVSGYADVQIELKKMLKGEQADVDLQTEDILYVPSNLVKAALARTSPALLAAASGAASAAVYTGM